MFQKILVANRGEIAIRVLRAANEMGKRTVAVYAEEDKLGLHRFKADEAYRIGEGLGPVAAYLSIPEIIRVAKASGADAIHPGYGLLSENPDFVDACTAAGIAFIGPTAETMRALGDKASARRVAIQAGVPVIPATEVLGEDMAEIAKAAEAIGYPLMLKASWGGGGRGMRPIAGPQELEAKVREGRREAEAAFGNGEGYLEKMIGRARHVEVQLLGDTYGGLYHLYERDCTVQRRNQKVVERAPAPYLTEEQRAEARQAEHHQGEVRFAAPPLPDHLPHGRAPARVADHHVQRVAGAHVLPHGRLHARDLGRVDAALKVPVFPTRVGHVSCVLWWRGAGGGVVVG